MAKFRFQLYPEQSSIVRVTAAAGRYLPGLGAAHTSAAKAGAQAAEVTSGSTIVHRFLTLLLSYYIFRKQKTLSGSGTAVSATIATSPVSPTSSASGNSS